MKRAPNQPVESLTLYAGIFCKVYVVQDAGTLLPQHSHEHDHLTIILQGAVRVWQDGKLLGDYMAPATIKIPALTMHSFLTLRDAATIACIHNADHVDAAGEVRIAEEHTLEMED